MSRVEDEVRLGMTGRTGKGLVAVSGGPDSVALLRALVSIGTFNFTIVHANHKLRGEESDGDEAFVKELAENLNVPFRSNALPIPQGGSIEATARNRRYGWFREVAKERNCEWLATAHSADDQAETVLHRIIRGTGFRGLIGMTRISACYLHTVDLVRPMLRLRRPEIMTYLQSLEQSFRMDASNDDTRFTRNRIRNEVLPLLRTLNPRIEDALQRLSQRAGEYNQYFILLAADLLHRSQMPQAGDFTVLSTEAMDGADAIVVREMFRLLWKSKSWPMGEMSDIHWRRMSALMPGDYPGGISVRRVGKVVQLRRKS